MSTIHERIKAARIARGLSMEKLAELVGLRAYQAVQQWENGTTAPKRKRLEKVAQVLGVTPEYLSLGAEPEELSDHAPVRMVDAKASAGRGELVMSTDVTKVLMFRRDWLAHHDAKPDQTIAFEVKGDSLIDVHIIDGSVVLANRSRTEAMANRFYVLWIDGKLYVKQLIRRGGIWYAHSCNASKADEYPDIQLGSEDRIVGRVFWCGFGV